MKQCKILILLLTACVGCVPTMMRDPVLIGKDIAVADMPKVVSATALATTKGGQIVGASVVEFGHIPDLYIIKIKGGDGTVHLLEVSPDGKKIKDVTEPTVGGDGKPVPQP